MGLGGERIKAELNAATTRGASGAKSSGALRDGSVTTVAAGMARLFAAKLTFVRAGFEIRQPGPPRGDLG
jgi:hypothetical protein